MFTLLTSLDDFVFYLLVRHMARFVTFGICGGAADHYCYVEAACLGIVLCRYN
jgi:hypothetical protein